MELTMAMETKSLKELTQEYAEMLAYGYVMGFGTRTYWKLTNKYGCEPEALWKHLSLKEKMLLWGVEHDKISDSEAVDQIVVIEF